MLIRATLGQFGRRDRPALGWSTATAHPSFAVGEGGDAGLPNQVAVVVGTQYLSIEQEHALLSPSSNRRQPEGMLTVTEIQRAYEAQTGRQVVPIDDLPPAGSSRLAQVGAAPLHPRPAARPRPRLKKLPRAVRHEVVRQAKRGVPSG